MANVSAFEFKEQGNRCFSTRKYADAAAYYSKAIVKNPQVATFFTNRALCHLKLKQWTHALQDCKQALELDKNLVKGHFFYGQALLELEMFDEAIASLTKAHNLTKDQRLNFGDEITGALRNAKKRRFALAEEKRLQEEITLQTYLLELIDNERHRQTMEVQELTGDNSCQSEIDKIEKEHAQKINEVKNIFKLVDDKRKMRDVPDYLCGKISFELLRDPVITPSGITYDRKDIEEHLQRVGHFDPVTRKELVQEQLIPNLSMKEVVEAFLEENPWAEGY